MFNLEQSITDWRQQMLAAGIQSPVPLEELENHLRENIEEQIKSGLDEEQSFKLSVQQIGGITALKAEFAKTDGLTEKHERILARLILGGALLAGGWIFLMGVRAFLKYDMSLPWRLAGFADFAVLAGSVICWRWLNRVFPVIPDQRIRNGIGLAFALTGMIGMIVFMGYILPHFSFTEGQLTVLTLWALTLMAAMGTVLAGLHEAVKRKPTS